MLAKNCAHENLEVDKLVFTKELSSRWLEYNNFNYNQNTLETINILYKISGRKLPSNVLITESNESKNNKNIISLNIVYI